MKWGSPLAKVKMKSPNVSDRSITTFKTQVDSYCPNTWAMFTPITRVILSTSLLAQHSVSEAFSNDYSLVIMPWNFPFWVPFKTVIPPLVVGNSILLKPSHNTPLCGQALGELFAEAGFGKGEYYNMFIDHNQCEAILADRRIRSVKFTGSTENGKKVAVMAA